MLIKSLKSVVYLGILSIALSAPAFAKKDDNEHKPEKKEHENKGKKAGKVCAIVEPAKNMVINCVSRNALKDHNDALVGVLKNSFSNASSRVPELQGCEKKKDCEEAQAKIDLKPIAEVPQLVTAVKTDAQAAAEITAAPGAEPVAQPPSSDPTVSRDAAAKEAVIKQ